MIKIKENFLLGEKLRKKSKGLLDLEYLVFGLIFFPFMAGTFIFNASFLQEVKWWGLLLILPLAVAVWVLYWIFSAKELNKSNENNLDLLSASKNEKRIRRTINSGYILIFICIVIVVLFYSLSLQP